LVDFVVGAFEESLDPLAVGLLLFLLTLGPLEDFNVGDFEDFVVGALLLLSSLAMVVAQMRAKRRKRVLREFIVCGSFV
jgi:hypothetical protein